WRAAWDNWGVHKIIERVRDGTQMRIAFLAHVAGKNPEPLSCLDRGPRENDAVDFLAFEQLHSVGYGQPGLAGSRRTGAEHQRVAAQRADIGVLRRRARAHGTLAQIDFLEDSPRRRRVVVEQRALRACEANGALDVTGNELVAALELLVESLKHAPRMFYRVTRSGDGHVIAALVRDYAEPALDQGEILPVLPEQQRRQPIVVE